MPSEKTQAKSEYVERIDRVIDCLRGNLHRPVKLVALGIGTLPAASETGGDEELT